MLDCLTKWCNKNKLTINICKTKHMFVSRRKEQKEQSASKSITIDNTPLDNVDKYTYLGVDIDYYLSFDSMVDNIYKKRQPETVHVELIRPYITNGIVCLIYKTCLRPILEYADFLIDSCTQLRIEKLDGIQKRSVKIIDGYKHRGMKYEDLLVLYGSEHIDIQKSKSILMTFDRK